jgi:hypothetical protein
MATKLISIMQKESGPFTPSNNLVSIDMEGGNVTDLSKSYLDMEVVFTNQAGNPLPNSRVKLGDFANETQYDGAAFVKHATLRSDTVGLVEQCRYNNIYHETMKQFLMSSEEEKASVALGNNQVVLDASGTGHILVPLNKLLGCAKNGQMYPDYRMGQSRLELELEDRSQVAYVTNISPMASYVLPCDAKVAVDVINNVIVTQPFNTLLDAERYFAVGRPYNIQYNVGAGPLVTSGVVVSGITRNATTGKVTVIFEEFVDVPDGSNINNITILTIGAENPNAFTCEDVAGGVAITPVNMFEVVDAGVGNFRVGEKYSIGFLERTTAGLVGTDEYKVFTSNLKTVVIDPAEPDNVILTFETSYSIAANKSLDLVFIFGAPVIERVDWSFTKINLIQAKPLSPTKVPEYQFQTQLLEQINHPGGVNQFRRQVQLESGTDMVVAINPKDGTLLGYTQFNTYRNSVNGVDTITKDVEIEHISNGSLYFDRLIYAFDDLKRLQTRNGLIEVSAIPERITPEQALEPNNVIEFQFRRTVGAEVVAGLWYFFKRNTRTF